jgi:hypothetical protein
MGKRLSPTKEDGNEVKALRKKNAELQKIIERMTQEHEDQRKAKFTIPKGRMTSPRGSFIRLVIPDTHGCFIEKAAARAMLKDASNFDVKEVVFLGDHVDCGGFLSAHSLAYVAEADYTYQDDINSANVFLDEVTKACPGAKNYFICGNHERRVERWCLTQAVKNAVDAQMLLKALDPVYLLHLKERGIEYIHTLDNTHSKGNTRNTLELGKCLFLHGYSHAQHATQTTLNDLAKNAVVGHIHRRQSFARTTHASDIEAWCPGCLTERRKFYCHGRPTHHSHGYGLQIVKKDGAFLHINVPIINGKSYLSALKSV